MSPLLCVFTINTFKMKEGFPMKKVIRRCLLLCSAFILMISLSGCGNSDTEIQSIAQQFTNQLFTGKWKDAQQLSTGEQLSILQGEQDTLDQLHYQGTIDRLDVVSVNSHDDIASTVIHFERTVKIDNVNVPDSRTIRLGLTKINEKWYVYQMIELKQDELY